MSEIENLQQEIADLRYQHLALVGLVNSLVASLHRSGIDFGEKLHRQLAAAANDLEEMDLPESAKYLDELCCVVDNILLPE